MTAGLCEGPKIADMSRRQKSQSPVEAFIDSNPSLATLRKLDQRFEAIKKTHSQRSIQTNTTDPTTPPKSPNTIPVADSSGPIAPEIVKKPPTPTENRHPARHGPLTPTRVLSPITSPKSSGSPTLHPMNPSSGPKLSLAPLKKMINSHSLPSSPIQSSRTKKTGGGTVYTKGTRPTMAGSDVTELEKLEQFLMHCSQRIVGAKADDHLDLIGSSGLLDIYTAAFKEVVDRIASSSNVAARVLVTVYNGYNEIVERLLDGYKTAAKDAIEREKIVTAKLDAKGVELSRTIRQEESSKKRVATLEKRISQLNSDLGFLRRSNWELLDLESGKAKKEEVQSQQLGSLLDKISLAEEQTDALVDNFRMMIAQMSRRVSSHATQTEESSFRGNGDGDIEDVDLEEERLSRAMGRYQKELWTLPLERFSSRTYLAYINEVIYTKALALIPFSAAPHDRMKEIVFESGLRPYETTNHASSLTLAQTLREILVSKHGVLQIATSHMLSLSNVDMIANLTKYSDRISNFHFLVQKENQDNNVSFTYFYLRAYWLSRPHITSTKSSQTDKQEFLSVVSAKEIARTLFHILPDKEFDQLAMALMKRRDIGKRNIEFDAMMKICIQTYTEHANVIEGKLLQLYRDDAGSFLRGLTGLEEFMSVTKSAGKLIDRSFSEHELHELYSELVRDGRGKIRGEQFAARLAECFREIQRIKLVEYLGENPPTPGTIEDDYKMAEDMWKRIQIQVSEGVTALGKTAESASLKRKIEIFKTMITRQQDEPRRLWKGYRSVIAGVLKSVKSKGLKVFDEADESKTSISQAEVYVDPTQNVTIMRLAEDRKVALKVLEFLEGDDIVAMGATCKTFYHLTRNDSLWRLCYYNRWVAPLGKMTDLSSSYNWKSLYKERYKLDQHNAVWSRTRKTSVCNFYNRSEEEPLRTFEILVKRGFYPTSYIHVNHEDANTQITQVNLNTRFTIYGLNGLPATFLMRAEYSDAEMNGRIHFLAHPYQKHGVKLSHTDVLDTTTIKVPFDLLTLPSVKDGLGMAKLEREAFCLFLEKLSGIRDVDYTAT